MNGKTLIQIEKPQTQCIDAIKNLLAWKGRASDPLPEFVEMGKEESRLVLVLSNKRDCYYVATARDCSCPAHNWHPGQRCKHQRAHFPEQQTAKLAGNTIKHPNQGAWHGHNGPVAPDTRAETAKVSSPSFELVDCLPDANSREIAYWSIAQDREMWPAEA